MNTWGIDKTTYLIGSGEFDLAALESRGTWPYRVINQLGQTVASGNLEALAEGRYRVRPNTMITSGLYSIVVQSAQGPVLASWVYEE